MDWQVTTLGHVCEFENGDRGKNYPSRSKFVDSGIAFINAGHVNDGIINFSKMNYISDITFSSLSRGKVRLGDVLFCLRGSLGKFAVVEKKMQGAIASSLVIIRPKNLSPEFLAHYLRSAACQKEIEKYAAGAAQPNLGAKDLAKFEIPLPSIPEQQRIVSILDQACADIEKVRANAEKNLKNALELFDCHVKNIFSQKKDGWREKSLGELGKVSMCKRILKKHTSAAGDIPFYKIGTFGKTANAFIDADLYYEYKTRFPFPKVGDVLISASGTIGRCVVFDGEPAYFQDSNIVWIDNDERLVSNEYLLHFYRVCEWNPSKGATISRLYNDDLRKIKIAFPNIPEQLRVSKDIAELDKQIMSLKQVYYAKLTSLDELKKSLLQKAFSGELTKTEGHAA